MAALLCSRAGCCISCYYEEFYTWGSRQRRSTLASTATADARGCQREEEEKRKKEKKNFVHNTSHLFIFPLRIVFFTYKSMFTI
jgi:hypothetical protein